MTLVKTRYRSDLRKRLSAYCCLPEDGRANESFDPKVKFEASRPLCYNRGNHLGYRFPVEVGQMTRNPNVAFSIRWQIATLFVLTQLIMPEISTQAFSQDALPENELATLESQLVKMTKFARQQKKLAEIRRHAILLQRAKEFWDDGDIIGARQLLESTDAQLRGFEFGHLSSILNGGHREFDAGRSIGSNSIAVSGDGQLIVTGGVPFDKHVRIWDGENFTLLQTLQGHKSFVEDVDIANDGTFVASCGIRGQVIIWDAVTGVIRLTIEADEHEILSIAISPDDKRLVSTSKSGQVKVWEIATGELLIELDGHKNRVHACAFSPDGKWIATAGRTIMVWESETGTLRTEIKPNRAGIYVKSIAFSPDGNSLISGHWDSPQNAQIWDVETGEQKCHCPSVKERVNGVRFSPDGTQVAIACDDYLVHLCDAQTGELIKLFKGHDHIVYDVDFSPDGKRIISAGRFSSRVFDVDKNDWPLTIQSTGLDSISPNNHWRLELTQDTLKLTDTKTDRQQFSFEGVDATCLAFSADSSKMAAAGKDKSIRIWNVNSSDPIQVLDSPFQPADRLLFNPKGTQLVSVANKNMLVAWDVESGKKGFFRRTDAKKLSERSFGFSPNGMKAFFCDGEQIEILDTANGKSKSTLEILNQPSSGLPNLSFSPNSELILGGYSHPWGPGECVIVWDADSGKRMFSVTGTTGSFGGNVKWSPDGKYLMVKTKDDKLGDVLQVWDVASKKRKVTLCPSDSITDSAFFPDGKRAVSVGRNSIRFFDLETGELVYSLPHPGVRHVEISPDGEYLRTISGPSRFRTTKIWRRQ